MAGSSCSPRDSQESFSNTHFKSINSSALSFLHSPTLTSINNYWKTIALTRQTLVGKVMSLFLNMLSRLVITFLPRSRRLLVLWLQAPSAVILEPLKIKSDTVSTVSPSISHEVMESDAMIFSSVQFSCSVVSNYLRPHKLQHARPPCPSPTPRVYSDSRPSSQ